MAFKCNGMKPEKYKKSLNMKIANINNSDASELLKEQEIENIKNESESIKTFTQDAVEKIEKVKFFSQYIPHTYFI